MTDWQSALEAVAADYTRGTLERDARAISEAYRLKTGEGKRRFRMCQETELSS